MDFDKRYTSYATSTKYRPFPSTPKFSYTPSYSISSPYSQAQKIADLISISTLFAFSIMSFKWIHSVCGLCDLASFT